jgi:hypothetical protein
MGNVPLILHDEDTHTPQVRARPLINPPVV